MSSYKAAWACIAGTTMGAIIVPGWGKIAPLILFVGCLYQEDAARRRLEDCLRAHGRLSEADILKEHRERLAAEVEYLESLGVRAA
ncbi:MAG TPA: hypothetical protein VLJ59_00740 [Mycobacteriales bacterium]|nr:hypothetical protein [Mycobacteriales bacterium]